MDRIVVFGWPVATAAEAAGVSRQTAYRWLRRFEAEGDAGLEDRSSRPLSCPTRMSTGDEDRIVADRLTHRDGPHLMAGRLGIPRSTIYAVLRRRGLSRLSTLDRTTGVPIRYVRDHRGELVHVDIKKIGKIPNGGGWRVNGREAVDHRAKGKTGYEFVHSMVDDHSRVAYSEVLDAETADTCAGFMLRAAWWFAEHGYRIERVMTDNALAYRSGARTRAVQPAHRLLTCPGIGDIEFLNRVANPSRPRGVGWKPPQPPLDKALSSVLN